MKEYKEIRFEELTLEQKLGMSFIASCADNGDYDVDYVEELIRNRSLGGVWVPTRSPNSRELIARLKSLADYPLLFLTDAETGWGEYMTTYLYMPSWPSLGYAIYFLQQRAAYMGMPAYFAIIIVSMVPTIGIFVAFQETIMQNMTTGGLKG